MTTSPGAVLLGAQHPQTLRAPDFTSSAGEEAVEIAATCGLACDPWQGNTLHIGMGERRDALGRVVWAARTVVVVVSRQNGKGGLLEARALAGALMEPNQTVAWTAHEFKTVKEAYRRVQALIAASDELARQVRRTVSGNNETSIEFVNGSRIVFATRTAGALRGFTINLLILDEAYALTDDQMSAILPTLSAVADPQVWLTSSPPLSGDTGEVMYQIRQSALDGADGIAYLDWGPPDVDLDDLSSLDLDDPAVWAATNPAYGLRISAEAVAAERSSMTPEAFARERVGVWPRRIRRGGGVIPAELWRDLVVEPEYPTRVAYAIAVNHQRTYTAIAEVGARADGRLQATIVDYREGTNWVADRAKQLKQQWSPIGIACQDKGPSGTLIAPLGEESEVLVDGVPHLVSITPPADRDAPRCGDLAVPWANDVAIAYGLTIDALTERRLVHMDNDVSLNVAVAGAQTRRLGGGTAWEYRGPVDVSPLEAVSLALWLYQSWADLVTVEYDPLANII